MLSAGQWRAGHRMHDKERVVVCKVCRREFRTLHRQAETCSRACSEANKEAARAKWRAKR